MLADKEPKRFQTTLQQQWLSNMNWGASRSLERPKRIIGQRGYGDGMKAAFDGAGVTVDMAKSGAMSAEAMKRQCEEKTERALFSEAQRLGLTPGAAWKAIKDLKLEK